MGHDAEGLLGAALARFIGGDLRYYASLAVAREDAVREAARTCGSLWVTRATVARVLRALIAKRTDPEVIQGWASVVRWGLLWHPAHGMPITVDVAFDSEREEQLIDVVARLDEIGDLVDGIVSPEEAQGWLRLLQE